MLVKLYTLLLLPLALYNFNHKIRNKSAIEVIVEGEIEKKDLFEKMTLKTKFSVNSLINYFFINVYDGEVKNEYYCYCKALDKMKKDFEIKPFTKTDEERTIRIEYYLLSNKNLVYSHSFRIQAPNYRTYVNSYLEDSYKISLYEYPVKKKFKATNDKIIMTNESESVSLQGDAEILMDNSPFIDLSKIKITMSHCPKPIKNAEVRIYAKLEGSDMIYRNDYTTFDVSTKKISNYEYCLQNEYKFYIDKNTGMINENYREGLDDIIMPFFIPISLSKSKYQVMDIIFSDVGINHCDYVFRILMKFSKPYDDFNNTNIYGKVLKYKYIELTHYLKGISYA